MRASRTTPTPARRRHRLLVRGLVQGVGFRPFVYRLARELMLGGYVTNTGAGARVEIEGAPAALETFRARLLAELPPPAAITECAVEEIPAGAGAGFSILESDRAGRMQALVLPDIATCAECLAEIRNPSDRRYRYPFTNCTHCGPRYSIIEAMPYDRPYTTMAGFTMCADCRREYEDPGDRRFHAQPVACPACGPMLSLCGRNGNMEARGDGALRNAAAILRNGGILALKGLGGFQLLADAGSDRAVALLRERKRRDAKPFALMYADAARMAVDCALDPVRLAIIQSPEAPIVLAPSRPEAAALQVRIAPDTRFLGVMAPYTPLHHLLLAELSGPAVATSGNLDEEPICIDNADALARLAGIADAFLVHDRPIARQVDDSIVTVVEGAPMLLRRARGYAPGPLDSAAGGEDVFAVGAHLKNSVAYRKAGTIFPSQHIGNLENVLALDAFRSTADSMRRLFEAAPVRVVHDLHPDYASTRHALALGLPAHGVQHHYAHVLSCMAEHGLEGPVLGVSWDGTGYGLDGTIWGSEFLRCTRSGFERIGSLRPFPLPGGDAAARAPWRCAASLLHGIGALDALAEFGPPETLPEPEWRLVRQMLDRNFNAPVTTSMGRLFDALASLCGLCQHSQFEGQAAMRLERAAAAWRGPAHPLPLPAEAEGGRMRLDWRPLVAETVAARRAGVPAGAIALGFHEALAEAIADVARANGQPVILTGGCFQNVLLHERALAALKRNDCRVYRHGAVPPNDGGIAVGQAWFQPGGEEVRCV